MRKVKSKGNKGGKVWEIVTQKEGESGGNELSGICHDFTHLAGDKVMNVNDRRLLHVRNARLM